MESLDQSFSILARSLASLQEGSQESFEAARSILDEKLTLCTLSRQNLELIYPILSTVLEKFDPRFVNTLLCLYLSDEIKAREIVRKPNKWAAATDSEMMGFKKQAMIMLRLLFEEANKNKHSLFDCRIKPDIGSQEKEPWLTFLQGLMDGSFDTPHWTALDREFSIFLLDFHYEASRGTDFSDTFYLKSTTVLKKLVVSKEFDIANRLLKPILELSFDEDRQEFAFYLTAIVHLAKGNILQSLLMLCMSAKRIHVKNEVNEKLFLHIHLDSVDLVGRVGLQDISLEIFALIKAKFQLNNFEDATLHFKYFSFKLSHDLIDDRTIREIHDYVISKDLIFELATLGNQYLSIILGLKVNFPLSTQAPLLDSLLVRFKESFGEETYRAHESRYDGSDVDSLVHSFYLLDLQLKQNLKIAEIESILRSHNGEISILHNTCVRKEEINGYLVSMMFKVDYALSTELLKGRQGPKNLIDFKAYKNHILSNLDIGSSELLYLSTNHRDLFVLSLHQHQFGSIEQLNDWTYRTFTSWLAVLQHYLTGKQPFVNDKHSLIVFSGIEIEKTLDTREVLLVKDAWISNFPHNLLTEKGGAYILLKKPIVDVISTDLLINRSTNTLSRLSIEAYVPIIDNDRVIKGEIFESKRFQKMIGRYNIKVETAALPARPINGILNIVVAHGSQNIKDFFAFNTGSQTIMDIDKIVGEGKIAILFVCNAGSQKMSDYTHKVASLVRLFLAKKYETVIAPAWDLYATVPPIWLEEFLTKFETGVSVSEAFQAATYKVYTIHKNPIYWACLHIYGNPHLRLV